MFTNLHMMFVHGTTSTAPIIDVHNHLSPSDIAGDRVWETLSDLWLEDDHYKWKAMRLAGFSEQLVTGDADPRDRFAAWAATVPRAIRNPLYAWTHLELRRVFGIDLPLNPSTPKEIWDEANRQLPQWSAQRMLPHFQVRAVAAIVKIRSGEIPDANERASVLLEVVSLAAQLAHADDSVFQLHLGPLRNASPRLLAAVGRDVGADVMNDQSHAAGLARFLGDLEAANTLPRTILYNLNPADNALFATMSGAFSRAGVQSLVQWGPPWWFNDHEEGMRRQLDDLSQIGQLAGFIGMLTDSRSILSMTRHELFRRILCNAIGRDVEAGRIPHDSELLTTTVHDICIGNAVRYFGFPTHWTT
jgi:glucuronate isomerase